ncbi:hypothetical protein DVH05_017005 [Phytophthora capsici]|nr:hypothetical protein DVH05_017005 [Phytophthora capsici]
MLSWLVIICCALVLLLLILAAKYYYKFLPRSRAVQPPSITLVGISNLPSENTIEFLTSYHLARPTPVSKTHTLSPIREESWMSMKSFASSLTLGDSIPKSPVILTSLVSPLEGVLSPPPAVVTPLPAVGFV